MADELPAEQGSAEPEAKLVARLKRGDEAAYETLVRTQLPRMLNVARRLMDNDEDARDVAQDAFLSAFKAMSSFAGESKLSTWLHRIVVNTALMRLRSRRRRPEEPLEPLLPAFKEDGHHVSEFTTWSSAEDSVALGETRAAVRAAINRLPEGYRTVLMLRDIEGFDTAETATALGITENAVKIRLHRARQALRGLIEPSLRTRIA